MLSALNWRGRLVIHRSVTSGKTVLSVVNERMRKGDVHEDFKIQRFNGIRNPCLFVACLASQQHTGVSQGRICSDKCTCCHTEIEVADQTFNLTQSQYADAGPTSPSADL